MKIRLESLTGEYLVNKTGYHKKVANYVLYVYIAIWKYQNEKQYLNKVNQI